MANVVLIQYLSVVLKIHWYGEISVFSIGRNLHPVQTPHFSLGHNASSNEEFVPRISFLIQGSLTQNLLTLSPETGGCLLPAWEGDMFLFKTMIYSKFTSYWKWTVTIYFLHIWVWEIGSGTDQDSFIYLFIWNGVSCSPHWSWNLTRGGPWTSDPPPFTSQVLELQDLEGR